MGSTKCSGGSNCSGLSSSSTCSSPSTSMSSYTAMATDQMVKVEIEAAEALADLAHFAMRETGGQPSTRKWGTKGKRPRKEVKSESRTPDMGNNLVDSLTRFSDLDRRIEDSVVVCQQQSEGGCRNQLAKPLNSEWEPTKKMVKADKEVESLKPSPACTTNYPLFGCRRSRRNLTEAEKEERRIRRILANRESARQTIRRRQALCEELTKKAADLAWENENLKREKELALKEYHSLETTNKQLKEQMAQAVKPKVEEIPGNDRSSHVQMPPLPSNYPLFLYSRPALTPYYWPAVFQSSSPYQSLHELHNVIVIPSSFHLPANNIVSVSDSSHEQENFTNINGSRAPCCVLPCSWLLPHHDHRNQLDPQIPFSREYNQEEIYLNSQSSAHPSKVVAYAETQHSSLPSVEEIKEAPNLNEASNSKDHSQNTVGVVVEGLEIHEVGKILPPARFECIGPTTTVKQDNGSEDDNSPSSRACHNSCAFPEKKHEPEILLSKKIIDSVAAAEARKRRRELTKLKNLHGRPCRLHY